MPRKKMLREFIAANAASLDPPHIWFKAVL
jgi:hypothetical protein